MTKAIDGAGICYFIGALEIAEVTDISDPPGKSREALDASHHKSPNKMKEYISGFGEIGEVKFNINWIPGDDESDALFGYVDSGEVVVHRHVWPNGHEFSFSGFIMDLTPAAPLNGILQMTVTVRTSGDTTAVEATPEVESGGE